MSEGLARHQASMTRLALNTRTTKGWSLPEAVAGCQRAGITHIGVWRDQVEALGLDASARLIHDSGLTVSTLCRGGFFPMSDPDARAATWADNRSAIDDCVALGTTVLVLVCGGLAGRDLVGSRQQVADGVAALAGYAADRGVRLAIEPLHPMFCADRSVVSTLDQAVAIASEHPADVVGVCVDTYHVWWDDRALALLPNLAGRVFAYQVCDWLDPLPDVLLGRGMMGDGVIDFAPWTRAVDAAGYRGPVEVEIFSRKVWDTPGDDVLNVMRDRYEALIAPHLVDGGGGEL
jgi:sugar phosphate isomerase/epimerase